MKPVVATLFTRIVVPVRGSDGVEAVGIHAGLWTSQALSAAIEDVPVLRKRLSDLEQKFGFDPSGHSGKALRHAITSLPRDVLINLPCPVLVVPHPDEEPLHRRLATARKSASDESELDLY